MDHQQQQQEGDQTDAKKSAGEAKHSVDYAPYPKLDPKDCDPLPSTAAATNQENWGTFVNQASSGSQSARQEPSAIPDNCATAMPGESNPYVSSSPAPSSSSSIKDKMGGVRDALGRWGKKVGETTKKAEDLAGNMWQHLKTAPSVADAAMGRIAQGTKVLAEGGYEKIFRQTFETVPEEELKNSYACYLSTSAGPVMGILYISTAKLAFCSDNPLSYVVGDKTEWSYYKVVLPLDQLKAVNPSASKVKRAEKYIQIITVDGHEFWFMGFVNYDSAVINLQEALQGRKLQSLR